MTIPMVESNNAEERLARIEHMVEKLQRESAAMKAIASKLIDVVAQAAPTLAPTKPSNAALAHGPHAVCSSNQGRTNPPTRPSKY